MDTQHAHARQLLQVFRGMVENNEGVILGYDAAAKRIGLDGNNYARHMGQVCSRIDAASFVSGYPMLALHMVRKPGGALNPESFGPGWSTWANEIWTAAESHAWTVAEVDEVLHALDGLPKNGAAAIWAHYLQRENQTPGFVRFNLHRKVRRTTAG